MVQIVAGRSSLWSHHTENDNNSLITRSRWKWDGIRLVLFYFIYNIYYKANLFTVHVFHSQAQLRFSAFSTRHVLDAREVPRVFEFKCKKQFWKIIDWSHIHLRASSLLVHPSFMSHVHPTESNKTRIQIIIILIATLSICLLWIFAVVTSSSSCGHGSWRHPSSWP